MSNLSPGNRTHGTTASLGSGFLVPNQLNHNTSVSTITPPPIPSLHPTGLMSHTTMTGAAGALQPVGLAPHSTNTGALQPSAFIGHKSYMPTITSDDGTSTAAHPHGHNLANVNVTDLHEGRLGSGLQNRGSNTTPQQINVVPTNPSTINQLGPNSLLGTHNLLQPHLLSKNPSAQDRTNNNNNINGLNGIGNFSSLVTSSHLLPSGNLPITHQINPLGSMLGVERTIAPSSATAVALTAALLSNSTNNSSHTTSPALSNPITHHGHGAMLGGLVGTDGNSAGGVHQNGKNNIHHPHSSHSVISPHSTHSHSTSAHSTHRTHSTLPSHSTHTTTQSMTMAHLMVGGKSKPLPLMGAMQQQGAVTKGVNLNNNSNNNKNANLLNANNNINNINNNIPGAFQSFPPSASSSTSTTSNSSANGSGIGHGNGANNSNNVITGISTHGNHQNISNNLNNNLNNNNNNNINNHNNPPNTNILSSAAHSIAMARPPIPTVPWNHSTQGLFPSSTKGGSPQSISPPNGRDNGLIPQKINLNPSLIQPTLATLCQNPLAPPHLTQHSTTQAQHVLHENMRKSNPLGVLSSTQIGLSQPPRARPALLNLMTDTINHPIELAAAQALHYSNNPLEPPHLEPTTSLIGPHAVLNGVRGQYEVGQHLKNASYNPVKRPRPPQMGDDLVEMRSAPANAGSIGGGPGGVNQHVQLQHFKPLLPPNVAQYVGGQGSFRYPAEPYTTEEKAIRLEEWNAKRKEILTGDEAEQRSHQRKQTAESRPRKGGRFIKKTEAEKLEASKRKREEQQRLREQQNQQ